MNLKSSLLCFIILLAPWAKAQDITSLNRSNHYAVLFNGTNDAQLGSFFPVQIETWYETTNPPSPFVLMSYAEVREVEATNYATYASVLSNRWVQAQAKLNADLSDFLAKMDKIETWIDRTSGTNSLTNAQRDNAINDICQTFKKLRRALVNLYKPE